MNLVYILGAVYCAVIFVYLVYALFAPREGRPPREQGRDDEPAGATPG